MDERIYQMVATVHDPRTDAGMQETPVYVIEKQVRIQADRLAQKWANDGYWTSVYNQKTAECVIDYPPKGELR